MTIEKLEYFYVIARYNSISKASKELHVSISSLSTSLKSLEQELGYDLFDRKGKKINLSEHGKQVLPSVMMIINEAQKLQIPLYETINRPVIRVGTSDASFIFEAQKCPQEREGYQLEYLYASSLDLLNKLAKKEIDFAITSTNIESPEFQRRPLIKLNFMIAMSEKLLPEDCNQLTAEELEQLPFLFLSDHMEHQRITKNINQILRINPKYIYCPDSLGANKLITEGKGVILVTSFEQKLLTTPSIRFVPLPIPCTIDFYLYTNSRNSNLMQMEEVEKHLAALFCEKK